MGNACSNCTTTEEESNFEMNQYNDTANFGVSTPTGSQQNMLKPNRIAIQSQHLENLPDRFKGGQYVLDNSNQNESHRVFSNDVSNQPISHNICFRKCNNCSQTTSSQLSESKLL